MFPAANSRAVSCDISIDFQNSHHKSETQTSKSENWRGEKKLCCQVAIVKVKRGTKIDLKSSK